MQCASAAPAAETFDLPYDVLVMAVGSSSARLEVEGVQQHCWFLRTIEHAQRLRDHLR